MRMIIREDNIFYITGTVFTIFKYGETVKVVNEKGKFIKYEDVEGKAEDVNYDVSWYKSNDKYCKIDFHVNFRTYQLVSIDYFLRDFGYGNGLRNRLLEILKDHFPKYKCTYEKRRFLPKELNPNKDIIVECVCHYGLNWCIYGLADMRGLLTRNINQDYGIHNNKIIDLMFKGKEITDTKKTDIMIHRLNNYKYINQKKFNYETN